MSSNHAGFRGASVAFLFAFSFFFIAAVFLPIAASAVPVPGQGSWETTLQPRDLTGDDIPDAYYDTVLDVTWLADANLGASEDFGVSEVTSSGRMTWEVAHAWIAAMNAAGYLGFSDWRLPTMTDIGGDGCNFAYSGTDCGYNVLTTDESVVYSELASLFYDTLGNLAAYDSDGNERTDTGPFNTGPFLNLHEGLYWFGLADAMRDDYAWRFGFGNGKQDTRHKDRIRHAWAVRSGDVAVVPLPGAAWLLGTGLVAFAGFVRRRC